MALETSTCYQQDQLAVQPPSDHGNPHILPFASKSSMEHRIYPLPSNDITTTCVFGTRTANEKRKQWELGDSTSMAIEALSFPIWLQKSLLRSSRSTVLSLSLILIVVAAATGAILFCSQFPVSEDGSNPSQTHIDPIQEQGPKPSQDSVPAVMTAIFIYCLAGGFLFYLHVRSRSKQLILSGVLVIATAIGLIYGFNFQEIVFRLLPWVYISGMILAGCSRNLEMY